MSKKELYPIRFMRRGFADEAGFLIFTVTHISGFRELELYGTWSHRPTEARYFVLEGSGLEPADKAELEKFKAVLKQMGVQYEEVVL